MKKVSVIAMLMLLFLSQPVSAKVTQAVDQYQNNFTIKSETSVEINSRAKLGIYMTKTYSTIKKEKPVVSLDFIVYANEYWFFNKYSNYLVDGDPVGKEVFLMTGHTAPAPGVVGTYGIRFLDPSNPITTLIAGNKQFTFRLSFVRHGFFEYRPTPETIQEWKQVMLFVPPTKP